jgi:hypothetical protein
VKKPNTSRVIPVSAPWFRSERRPAAFNPLSHRARFTPGDGFLARHHRNVLIHLKRRALASKFNLNRRADARRAAPIEAVPHQFDALSL